MERRRSRLSRVLVEVVLAALLAAVLAACGSSTASTAAKPYIPPEASDTPTLDPSEQLIPDGPLFLPLLKWLPSPTSERQLNPCLRESFVVLGADKLRYRSFHSSRTDAKGQDLVAVFHDAYAAHQAAYLLRRWQETCRQRLKDDSLTANPPQSVVSGRGSGVWFSTYQERGGRNYSRSATGLVQVGRLVAMVTVQDTTSNDNPDALEPALVRMVQRGYYRLA